MRTPVRSFNYIVAIIFMVVFAVKALPQTPMPSGDSIRGLHIIGSGGIITDTHGVGGIADLAVMYDHHIVNFSYAVEENGIGDVVTNISYDDLGGNQQTSYASMIRKIFTIDYGRRFTKVLSVTGGIAWVTDYSRSSANGYNDSDRKDGGYFISWTVKGNYHADLIEKKKAYLAVPITLKTSFETGIASGIELHFRFLLNMIEPIMNMGMSVGLGNF